MIFVFLASCSSTTVIKTSDPEAQIYIDGSPRGKGTVTYTDKKIIGSTTMVRIKKEGCPEQNFVITKSEAFQVGACIGGVLVLIPFLWIMGYNPEHYYEVPCEKEGKK